MRIALMIGLSLLPTPALADALTFSGALDGRSIIVELTEPSDGAVVGRFAYTDIGGDIPLTPVSAEGDNWVLHEEAPCNETNCTSYEPPIAAVWALNYNAENRMIVGTRTPVGNKPKTSEIMLSLLSQRALDAYEEVSPLALHERSARFGYDDTLDFSWETAPYEFALLGVSLKSSEVESLGDAQYVDVADPRTRFSFPRAIGFNDGADVARVNTILADRHYQLSLNAFDCLARRYAAYGVTSNTLWFGGTLGDYDSELIELKYLSPRVVSWTESGSLWCGGAHPYNHMNNYTYDIETGEPLRLDKVFSGWVARDYDGTIIDPDTAELSPDAYYWGPDDALIAWVQDRIPIGLFGDDDAEMLEYCAGDEALRDYLDIRFAAGQSVVFTLSGFPHAIASCEGDLLTASWDAVQPLLVPTAAEFFPAE